MKNKRLWLLYPWLIWPALANAIDEQHVREKAHTVYRLYLSPYEAFNMKKQQGDRVLLVDVRARADLKYVGASDLIDANIPSRFLDPDYTWSGHAKTYRTVENTHLIEDFEKLLKLSNRDKETPIILMCTSGSRVPGVAKKLKQAGFKTVYSQYQGFEGIKATDGVNLGKRKVYGWKNSNLPWGYQLNKDAMYFNFDSTRRQESD